MLPSSNANGMPLTGTRISITLESGLRYTGSLKTFDSEQGTFITLQRVDFHGTEGRKSSPREEVPGKRDVADYMRFQGCRIKKLEVISNDEDQRPPPSPVKESLSSKVSSPASSSSSSIERLAPPCSWPKDNKTDKLFLKEAELASRERLLHNRELSIEHIAEHLRYQEAEITERTLAINAREERLHHLPAKLWYMLGQGPEEMEAAAKEDEMSDWDECEVVEGGDQEGFEDYEVVENDRR